jgi:hypothetical protein
LLGVERGPSGFLENEIDLRQGEAGALDVEFHIDERLQFDREHLAVPPGIQCQLVVRQHVGPSLCGIEMGQAHRGDALESQELGCLHSSVPGDDPVLVADQHRVGEAEPSDALGDLPDLLLGMRAGVFAIRPQAPQRHDLDRSCLDRLYLLRLGSPAPCTLNFDAHGHLLALNYA